MSGRIIVLEKDFETRSLPLAPDKITIGRASKNHLVLKNRYTSSSHCEIVRKGIEWIVTDLGSTNGLFVNGAKVDNKTLTSGDKILVGAAMLIYVADEEAINLDQYVLQLQNGSAEDREIAASLLGQLGTAAVTEHLIAALNDDPDLKVKAAAAEALGLIGDSKAAKPLLDHFDTSDGFMQKPVVRSIIRLADDDVVESLADFLDHEEKKIRVLAAYTLGSIKNSRATKHLIKALKDAAFDVREAAVKALGDIGDANATKALITAADDALRFSQVWVIESLGKIGGAEALPTILKALREFKPDVREAAANALGKLRVKETAPALIEALEDSEAAVRKAAADSLEKLRKHLDVQQRIVDSSASHAKTMEISLVGDEEDGRGGSEPMYGEDRAQWEKWWEELS